MMGCQRLSKAEVWGALLTPQWVKKEEHFIEEKARECIKFVGLETYEGWLARNISYGHQRRLEIARGMASDPQLMLLDEPAAGMNIAETKNLMSLIGKIRERNVTVLVVEHNMKVVMNLCDRITVFNYGKVIAEGKPQEIQTNEEVIEAYLGRVTKKNLHVSYGPIHVLKGISIKVEEGRIVTLIGANGAGKSTTLNTISGLVHPSEGTIEFLGERIEGRFPEEIIQRRIVQVPEGRKVFRNLTVFENLLMGGYSLSDKTNIQEEIKRVYDLFPVLKERERQMAGTLSGGQQQMLAFARALVAKPRLLLLDEPSMGLAPQLVQEVANFIVNVRRKGMTILLVEQNAEVALSISDHGYVLETGQIVFDSAATQLLNDEQVQKSYLGM
jgi:ABC-type branched-subunit amino acid transport system ATPase component